MSILQLSILKWLPFVLLLGMILTKGGWSKGLALATILASCVSVVGFCVLMYIAFGEIDFSAHFQFIFFLYGVVSLLAYGRICMLHWLKHHVTEPRVMNKTYIEGRYYVSSHFFYLGRDVRDGFASYCVYPNSEDEGDLDFVAIAQTIMGALCTNLQVVTNITTDIVPNKKHPLENEFPYRYYHGLEQKEDTLLLEKRTVLVRSHGFPTGLFEAYQQGCPYGYTMDLQGTNQVADGPFTPDWWDAFPNAVLYMGYHVGHDYLDISVDTTVISEETLCNIIQEVVTQYGKPLQW